MLQVRAKKRLAGFELKLEFELQPSFTALFGASGSGKTTTLNLIAGLLTPDQGEVILDGSILFSKGKKINIKPRDRHIGYIFQESRLFPHLTVQKNLEFGLQRLPANGRKFSFADPPNGELPGTPIMCRCFADPVVDNILAEVA